MPSDDTLATLAGVAVLNLVAAAALMLGIGPGHPNGYGWRHALAGFSRRTRQLIAHALGSVLEAAARLARVLRR